MVMPNHCIDLVETRVAIRPVQLFGLHPANGSIEYGKQRTHRQHAHQEREPDAPASARDPGPPGWNIPVRSGAFGRDKRLRLRFGLAVGRGTVASGTVRSTIRRRLVIE